VVIARWLCAPALAAMLACTPLLPGHAATLGEALDAALTRDSQVRSARQELEAARARVDQANGSLWPQLNLTGNANRTRQALQYDGGILADRRDQFSTRAYNLQLTQALYRGEDIARRQVARMAEQQVAAQAMAAEQALVVRVAQPWFEACQHDHLARAAAADVARQRARLDALSRRLRAGDLAAPDLAMAGADLAQARARQTEAESERSQRLFTLGELTGLTLGMADVSCQGLPELGGLEGLDAWLDKAAAHSPELQAARSAVEVARAQLQQAGSGHSPTLDLVASKGVADQGPSASLNVGSKARTESIGLQLTVPVFSGGSVSARSREALALLGKAESDLDSLQARVRQDVSANWRSLQVALAHGQATAQRVEAWKVQEAAVQRLLAQGQAVDADVFKVQQELATAQADAARLLGMASLAQLRLQAQSGQPWSSAGPTR
jgi:TolC family type I secretion outer membrane protein